MKRIHRVVDRALQANRVAAQIANNAFDRMFRPGALIRSNQTPYEEIAASGPMRVRYYPPLTEATIPLSDGTQKAVVHTEQTVPIVIVPPLAATSLIFDLLPERSLVRYLRASGFLVYLVDWGSPERRYAHYGIKHYAEDLLGHALKCVRAHAQTRPVSLLGWCMGGLFSLIYAGLSHDRDIQNLITIASPIDYRQGGIAARITGALDVPAYLIRKYTSFRLHNVDPAYLQVPGWVNALAFKLTNPVGSLTAYWDLFAKLADREFLATHTTTSHFLENMEDYPGGIVQDFIVKVGVDNDLSRGRIEVGGRVSQFDRIECSLLVFAGAEDAIVTPQSAQTVLNLVQSPDKEFVIAPGGHAGVVMGNKAQAAVWSVLAQWLETRSGPCRAVAA
ncbi:MAG: alpha/beta fold hydrolase [Pseudomonadota bacterium]|nr:alpha/beta fold hydrolase [Pseudomonadota bacterium]